MMRVLHVIARMNAGGTARYLDSLSKGLTSIAIENRIATGFVQVGENEDQCVVELPITRIAHLGRRISPLNDFKAWREIKLVVETYKPDIIHSHTFKAGLLCRLLAGSTRHVHTYHGHIFSDRSLSLAGKVIAIRIERFLARRSDVLVSVGQKVAIELQNLNIGSAKKWISIAPGIESPVLPSRDQAAERLGIDPKVPTIGWLGRMVPVKNPLLAVDVGASLPNLNFVIAGDGELLETCRTRGTPNVSFPGWVSREDVLAVSDVIFFTSFSEGMPLAGIEAQRAHIPIVGPDVGSLAEIIVKTYGGKIVSLDKESLTSGIMDALDSAFNLRSKRDFCVQDYDSYFTVEKMVERHLIAYSQALQRQEN